MIYKPLKMEPTLATFAVSAILVYQLLFLVSIYSDFRNDNKVFILFFKKIWRRFIWKSLKSWQIYEIGHLLSYPDSVILGVFHPDCQICEDGWAHWSTLSVRRERYLVYKEFNYSRFYVLVPPEITTTPLSPLNGMLSVLVLVNNYLIRKSVYVPH